MIEFKDEECAKRIFDQRGHHDWPVKATIRPEAVQRAAEQWLTSPGRKSFPFGRSSFPIRLKAWVGLLATVIGEVDRPIPVSEYAALTEYLRDGRFEIDNNLVENAIRPRAVGRKRWLFLGHPEAGWRSAVIYSMIGGCRRRGLNPQEYLTDVLGRLPGLKTHQLELLLPCNWKPPTTNSS